MSSESIKYLVILFHGRGSADQIDRALVRYLQRQLDRVVTTPPEKTEIDLWLDSPGGDAHAAYKLMLELRSRCSRLQAVVPDFAKSATLMLMGVDSIYMDAAAELGPLDVQIEHPDREQRRVSALDVADSLSDLGKTGIKLAIAGGGSIILATGLPRTTVLHSTLCFVSRLLQPAVAKLDPHLIHEAARELQVAQEYAVSLLENRNVPEEQKLNRADAEAVIQHLVADYPSHSSIISRDEAKKLGLPVQRAEEYDNWVTVRRVHAKFVENGQSLRLVVDQKSAMARLNAQPASAEQRTKSDEVNGQATEEGEDHVQQAESTVASNGDGRGQYPAATDSRG